MELEDLIRIYADVNTISYLRAYQKYDKEFIDKFDLLDAFLENEGIFGYNDTFRELFKLLEII